MALKPLVTQEAALFCKQLASGYMSPEAFVHCDSEGMIQDTNNVPRIFHWRRNKASKRLTIGPADALTETDKFMFSTSIPKRDLNDFHRLYFKNTGGCFSTALRCVSLGTAS